VPEIHFSHIKIREVPGIFLNLSLNLNLAIFKMKIAIILGKCLKNNIYSYIILLKIKTPII